MIRADAQRHHGGVPVRRDQHTKHSLQGRGTSIRFNNPASTKPEHPFRKVVAQAEHRRLAVLKHDHIRGKPYMYVQVSPVKPPKKSVKALLPAVFSLSLSTQLNKGCSLPRHPFPEMDRPTKHAALHCKTPKCSKLQVPTHIIFNIISCTLLVPRHGPQSTEYRVLVLKMSQSQKHNTLHMSKGVLRTSVLRVRPRRNQDAAEIGMRTQPPF